MRAVGDAFRQGRKTKPNPTRLCNSVTYMGGRAKLFDARVHWLRWQVLKYDAICHQRFGV